MMEWLEQQSDLTVEHQTGDTSQMNLLETINIDLTPVSEPRLSLLSRFSLSQSSSSIAIGSPLMEPSLSVIYPGTDKTPLILSKDDGYTSVLFMIISGKEYLVAACDDEIRLWNLEKNASSVVYKFNELNDWHVCAIDERTVACAAELPDWNGSYKIYILNTDTEKFHKSSTMRVKMISTKVRQPISDTYFLKTGDGTACLLQIFSPINRFIHCVEIVGGKVRWQVGQEQMGESFIPQSACTDGSTVFVANAVMMLYLLSVEDGSVLTSINLFPFDITFQSCVRLQGERLFVGHMKKTLDTYSISKFIKPSIQDEHA